MTDQEINIAIAAACGWKDPRQNHGVSPQNWIKLGDASPRSVFPNYCHDLNAMYEAMVSLNDKNLELFCYALDAVTDRDKRRSKTISWYAHREIATAYQRAEAFLRCKGLWKD